MDEPHVSLAEHFGPKTLIVASSEARKDEVSTRLRLKSLLRPSSARFKIESHDGDKSRCDPATRRGEERRRERSEAGRATGERLSLQRKANRGADKACHYAKSLSQMTIIR
jgi:hypothetical protein